MCVCACVCVCVRERERLGERLYVATACVYDCYVAKPILYMYDNNNVSSTSTLKQDCKAGIKVSLSDDGQHLIVTEVNEEHNHDISKVISIQCHCYYISRILYRPSMTTFPVKGKGMQTSEKRLRDF